MKFNGVIRKNRNHWLGYVPCLDVMSQAKRKSDILHMVKDAVETLVSKPGFKVEIHRIGDREFSVQSDDIGALVALFLKRQRQKSGLTIRELAKRLRSKSPNAFARYEQGRTCPSVDTLVRLLAAINPRLNLSLKWD